MVKLTGIFNQLQPTRVMVVGDLLLDTYTIGKAKRISPEAPVAVVNVLREEQRPGGAGNVVLNLISLGVEVVVVGRVGADVAGTTICQMLESEGSQIQGIVKQPGFSTPIKNRILADGQQVVRIDHETISPIPELTEQQVIESLPALLEGIKVVAISDYGKGFLSRTLLSTLIDLARQQGIPVITDPKGVDFSKYNGTTLLKPNLGEAYTAANLLPDAPLEQAAGRIFQNTEVQTLMITRSEAGISLFHRDGTHQNFPVRVRQIKDVTGAGDTVLAMLTCALANDLSLDTAVQLSNVAAGIAIEQFGCARVTLAELARRMLSEDASNKVFDEEHLFALQQALLAKPFVLLSVSSQEGLPPALFQAIRQLRQHDKHDLVIYIRDDTPDPDYVQVLSSLQEVDFILLRGESLKSLCLTAEPQALYILEEGQCRPSSCMNEILG